MFKFEKNPGIFFFFIEPRIYKHVFSRRPSCARVKVYDQPLYIFFVFLFTFFISSHPVRSYTRRRSSPDDFRAIRALLSSPVFIKYNCLIDSVFYLFLWCLVLEPRGSATRRMRSAMGGRRLGLCDYFY